MEAGQRNDAMHHRKSHADPVEKRPPCQAFYLVDVLGKLGRILSGLPLVELAMAHLHICAPTSTIDMATATGADICIEQRKAEEVTEMWYKERMAPEGVKVYNPAFDVTDHELIAGIVTEYGVARAPYTESLKEIMKRKAQRG